jgi:hypothetical protein
MQDQAEAKALARRINDMQSEIGTIRVDVAQLKANMEWNTKLTLAVLAAVLALTLGFLSKLVG